ncbi:nucleotidyl transferase AbiEii/AbiGii toxin family protein [Brachybacterium sp. EF45031]|uniref:nucleotidyl transferase AbiEii/AbiGii toxin family protein n=1 Tax=Brachybacterium sillae TaxID=2810536 RepID=UPI00217DCFFF|nr:nucleotidyl transferase AbiEii/AbiGii toxin family protein [Brachybacterium sillae]MCS6711718.1 nucleotidyl transferase AbiEii/AbiGii toxin family protein [Brachybacterium sillae]
MDRQQDAVRRRVARLMLEALAGTEYVLTGASALAEHGLIHRETKDVDLFTVGEEGQRVPDVIPLLRARLDAEGGTLIIGREFPGFVDGRIQLDGYEIGFDLGADWRGYPPVQMDIGPVLDVRDSIGSKVAALYSRNESRDYMDVAAILLDGRWSADQIMTMGAHNDPGFDRSEFARILHPGSARFPSSHRFRSYGVTSAQEDAMREALTVLRDAALGEGLDQGDAEER